MKEEFEKNGYYVLRGVLTEAEVDQLAMPIRAAFTRGDYHTFHRGPAYPAAGIHSMGPRVLEDHPEIADVSLAHPKIMEAIEKAGYKAGEDITLALDCASSEFYKDGQYLLAGEDKSFDAFTIAYDGLGP